MATPPSLTLEQRREALAKAAIARKDRAHFKEEIKAGTKSWRDAFADDRESIQKMRIKELLESIPGFGVMRAQVVLERAGISTTRRIQGIGKTQRENLSQILVNK